MNILSNFLFFLAAQFSQELFYEKNNLDSAEGGAGGGTLFYERKKVKLVLILFNDFEKCLSRFL